METGTPNENLKQFRRIVLEDVTLQQQLRGIEDRAAFRLRVVELGAIHGYYFTVDDVEHAMRASRRAWVAQRIIR